MAEFLGAFFGSIAGMFTMGVVLTITQNTQRRKIESEVEARFAGEFGRKLAHDIVRKTLEEVTTPTNHHRNEV